MEFADYIKEKEAQLIKVIGEKDWKENKMYFVDEIISMVEEWKVKNLSSNTVLADEVCDDNCNLKYLRQNDGRVPCCKTWRK